jgi:hypothetical protein
MRNYRRYVAILPIIFGLSGGCNESKVAQCDRLIPAIKKTNLAAQSVLKTANNNPRAILEQGLSVTGKATANISAIQLSDPKLKEYQTSLLGLYRSNSQGSRQFLTALATKDRIKANQALNEWTKINFYTQERDLVNGINAYCFSGK